MAGYVRYDTDSEILFIRRLGEHHKHGQQAKRLGERHWLAYRVRLLQSYLDTLFQRKNPDGLDFIRLKEVAQEELESAKKALAKLREAA